ncbi:RcnB family protein [Sphingomonas sp. PB4P5]|uniref:RcnB family protein n=1 Tax=Parasphingomonas puruogangriensis TaxID=3096155 RepID=UPI002FCC700A
MRTSILAALMAATALIPAAAQAQRGERDGNAGWQQRGERPQGQARQPRQQNEARERVRPQAQPAVQAPAQQRPQAQPQVRPQRPDGNTGGQRVDRGDRGPRGSIGDRGGRGGYQPAPRPQAPIAQPNRQPTRDAGYRGNRPGGDPRVNRNDDNRGSQWRGNDNRGAQWRGNDNRGGQWRGNDNRGGQWRGNDGRGNDRGNWNRNWRQDSRYNWNQRRQYNRNIYHLPRYYAPNGWNSGYRRFGIGFTLSSILFNQNYWIDDAEYYGLPEAYGEYRWVRYYNDALLVDTYSGEVVDTVYDIFW